MVSGSVVLQGYPAHPTAIVVTDELGHSRSVALSADARFSTILAKGHRYHLNVTTEKRAVPLVFPRRSGRLDGSFAVVSNGVRIELGRVRYLPSAPAAGFAFTPTSSGTTIKSISTGNSEENERDDEIEDGANIQCGPNSNDDHSSQSEDEVDAQQEMAIPQHDPPETEGCNESDDQNNDGQNNQNDDDHDNEGEDDD